MLFCFSRLPKNIHKLNIIIYLSALRPKLGSAIGYGARSRGIKLGNLTYNSYNSVLVLYFHFIAVWYQLLIMFVCHAYRVCPMKLYGGIYIIGNKPPYMDFNLEFCLKLAKFCIHFHKKAV